MFNRLAIFILVLGAVFYFLQNSNFFDLDIFKANIFSPPLENLTEEKSEFIDEEPSLDEKLTINIELKEPKEENLEEENPTLTLGEIQEKLDDISEKVDVLKKEVAELVENNLIVKKEIKGAKDIIEEALEDDEIKKEDSEEEMEEDLKLGEEIEQEEIKFCEKVAGTWPNKNTVIINEVAWMGNIDSANNEWIELKNISGREINLSGWQIIDRDRQIKIILRGIIPINGFYLLERTNDDSLPGILADFIYTGALNDKEEALYLFNENCQLEDEMIAYPDWPAGDKETKRTMERRNDLNWQTSENPSGTPKKENSQPSTYSGGNLTPPPPPTPSICSQDNLSQPVFASIIINEIAWMGSASSTSDEWLELKNLSTSTISLNNWQLIGKKTENNEINIKIFFDDANLIYENSYFLLERTNDNSVPEILADKIFTGSVNDSGFLLRLFDDKCQLIDQVEATSTWPAGQKEIERRTMERAENLGWHTSFTTSSFNGLFGTPKAENSQPPSLSPRPILEVSTTTLSFKIEEGGENPSSQILIIENKGDGELSWASSIIYDSTLTDWLLINQATGTIPAYASSTIEISVNISGLPAGNYKATTTIEAIGAQNSPQEISINLTIFPKTVKTVIINEIAWMGTSALNPNDEWLELYNNATSTIDLTSWTLIAADGTPNFTFPTSSIPAHGFFLLERTDDITISDISADLIYTGAIENSGEKLELRDAANNLIDLIDCSSGWFAGTATSDYISMERINSNLPGSYFDNWADNNGTVKNGLDAEGNLINGTPKSQNSVSL